MNDSHLHPGGVLCLFHAYYAFTVVGTTCIVILDAVKHLLVKEEFSKLRMAQA